jgi:putative tricarboxylic transport membrane protein
MQRLEQIAAIAMMVLAVATFFGSGALPVWDEHAPGPRFLPLVIAGITILISIMLLIETRRRAPEAVDWPDHAGRIRLTLVMLAICAFVLSAMWIGFVLGSALFVALLLILVLRRPPLPSLATAIVTAVLVQGVFVWWLETPLPKSMIGI